MKPASAEVVSNVISLLNQTLSIREVARRANVSHNLVWKVKRRCLPNAPHLPAGRPEMLSVQQKRWIVRSISSGRVDTATAIQRELAEHNNTHINAQTVRNCLQQAGLKSSAKVKKPLLTKKHRQARLAFARKYQDWTLDDWKRVIWSDETKVNRIGSDGRKWCWRKFGLKMQSHHVQVGMITEASRIDIF